MNTKVFLLIKRLNCVTLWYTFAFFCAPMLSIVLEQAQLKYPKKKSLELSNF